MATDDAVIATNDDAAQCKRHAIEKGYWQDPYIAFFVPKGQQKHAPEINIGYYARVKGMHILLEKFLTVVNLGAGFDTTYWNLKDRGLNPSCYVEVDFPAVTSRKIHYIKGRKQLLEKFSDEDGEVKLSHTDLHGKDYHLVAANLKNLAELDKKLHEAGVDRTLPTVFIAECVLVYLENKNTEALLKWISESFPTCLFLNYEQVNMRDKFGDIMLENLKSRDCFLHIEACDSLQSQINRFMKQGWEDADAVEMIQVYSWLPQADVQRVEKIEFLDERELMDQLFKHYCISWASKDAKRLGLTDIGYT